MLQTLGHNYFLMLHILKKETRGIQMCLQFITISKKKSHAHQPRQHFHSN